MIIYSFYIGLILCILGILMKFHLLGFLITRFEGFQKGIRKKPLHVDREGLTKFYFILLVGVGLLFLIAALIELLKPINMDQIIMVFYIVAIMIGVPGILYCNLTEKFIIYE